MESSPTVINQPQESPNPTGSNNNTTGQAHVGVGGDPNQQQQQQQPHQEYNEDANHPRFRSGHNPFFFDMDDPHDFFTNPALRTRLSRFHNPWNSMFGQRKRRTSPPPTATGAGAGAGTGGAGSGGGGQDPYGDEFFHSHFDQPHWNEPRGWPPMNGARKRMQEPKTGQQDMFNYIPDEFRQYMPEQFGFRHHHHRPQQAQPPQPPTNPSQRSAQSSPQPQQYTQRNNSGEIRRPQFCDAGMQTDDVSPSESTGNVHEQKEQQQQQQQQSESSSSSPPHSRPESGFARSHADAGVGNSPNGSFASAQAFAGTGGAATPGTPGTPQTEGVRQTRSNSNSMGTVRRVPIIVEGQPSSLPKDSFMPHRQPPNRQEAPPQPPKRAQQPQVPPMQPREVPIQKPVEPPSPSVVSINKIQDIQQDVLDLMFKVEQYEGGNKEDKEYKYLDEMLTRNLLKLDTIDTRGNDSIRLARKEAIKCIQASLSVLEAKGRGLNAEEKKEGEQEVAKEEEKKEENEEEKKSEDEVDKSKIPIPLPPIPGQVPPATIRDCESDEEGK